MKTLAFLAKTRIKVSNAHPYKQKHGDKDVQAIALTLRWEGHQDTLLQLDDGLVDMLFYAPAQEVAQVQVEGVPKIKPAVRVPVVKQPLDLKLEFTGYTLVIDYGLGPEAESDLELYGCVIKKIKVEGKQGGSVAIEWTVDSNEEITPELVGCLCALAGRETEITQTPPKKADETPPIDGSTAAFKKDHPDAKLTGEAGPDATDLFLQSETGGTGEGAGTESGGDGAETGADAGDAGGTEPAHGFTDPTPEDIAAAEAKAAEARGSEGWPFPQGEGPGVPGDGADENQDPPADAPAADKPAAKRAAAKKPAGKATTKKGSRK